MTHTKPLLLAIFNKHFWASFILGGTTMLTIPHISLFKCNYFLLLGTKYTVNWSTVFMVIACVFICFFIPGCNLKRIKFIYRCLLSAVNTMLMMLGMNLGHTLAASFHFPKPLAFFSMVFMMSFFSALSFVLLVKLAHSFHESLFYQKKSM